LSNKFASIYYDSTLVNKRIYHTQINTVNGLLSSAPSKISTRQPDVRALGHEAGFEEMKAMMEV
jgi:hypothetical protein